MEKAKFTPAPWIFDDGYKFYKCFSSKQNRCGFYFEVGKNAHCNSTTFDEEWMTNARLISIAPEMYEQLLKIVNGKTIDCNEIRKLLSKV